MSSENENSTDDYSKKRKAIKDIEGYFEKSRKITRTPPRTQKHEEEKLDLILNMMKDMKLGQTEIKNETHQIREEQKRFNEEIEKLKQENINLRKENNEIKKENRAIKEELQDIKETVEFLEKARKKNNVMMNGLPMESNDSTVLKERINSFLKEHLEININVTYVTKIGEKACVVELSNEHDKSKVMLNKSKLKDLKTEKVYINDDLTKKEREKQRQIRKTAQEEKSKGNVVKIGYNKIIINGTEWRWNNKTEKLERTKSKN